MSALLHGVTLADVSNGDGAVCAEFLLSLGAAVRHQADTVGAALRNQADSVAATMQSAADAVRDQAAKSYDDLTKAELQDELGSRDLPKTGNVDELRERLVADDLK